MNTVLKLGQVSVNPRGAYDPEAEYERLDLVGYKENGYIALRHSMGMDPVDGEDWMLLVGSGSAVLAQSWAEGGTGVREDENTNNAKYYAELAQSISQGALGWYESYDVLKAAHETGIDGQWAIIGSTDTIWTWDSDTEDWKDSHQATDLSNYYTKEQTEEKLGEKLGKTEAAAKVANALTFTGGVKGVFDGSDPLSVAIPTTLPANGGNADTVGKIPIAAKSLTNNYKNDFRLETKGDTNNGTYFSVIRANEVTGLPFYSSGIAFGYGDTMGFLLPHYYDPSEGTWVGGGGGTKLNWLKRLAYDDEVGLKAYPVGAYYWSSSATSPASLFGGTWTQITDRFVLAAGSTYKVGATGGYSTVTLTVNQMPSHGHGMKADVGYGSPEPFMSAAGTGSSVNGPYIKQTSVEKGNGRQVLSDSVGGNAAHENMPPYIVAYCWRRTA